MLAEVEAREREVKLRSFRKIASRGFQAPDLRGDLLRGARGAGQEGQGVEVLRVLFEDERRFLPGLC